MIIRKLRLQRGWSQDKLAQISGLSVRTIQRIERGQQPGLESLQSLAAAFDVNINELKLENPMGNQLHENEQATNHSEEAQAMEYVRDIKGFYSHLIKYLVVISLLFIINLSTSSDYLWAIWPMLGWGVGVLSHGLNVFEVFNFFGPKWEKNKVEQRLGRKL
jgi:transcriptional regulator with XRE-family HTH domain